jgi:3-hydroxybutyryl-CoA dehydrogenase
VTLERVGIVGIGTMGSGIAEVFARAGLDTLVVDVNEAAVAAGKSRLETSLARATSKGLLTEAQRDEALARLSVETSLDAMADRDLVIEAAVENEAAKVAIFEHLDRVCPEHAILASNTSSISITRLATATQRPDKVVGMHFFNPATVQPLVEIVRGLTTAEEVADRVAALCTDVLGKKVIRAADRAGFVVNALLVPYLLSAIRMVEAGFASASDIDDGMRYGCAHPMGPLALCDLIGLDTIAAIADVLFDEFREPQYAAPPLLRRMVTAGSFGRKSGRGFFTYDK